ncbi:ARE2 [Candida oxycetoniae]|uniref:ARE2 n=1 Tax=Candida oxycetoniae TaxID=497107 RepID=A0AAI9WXP5_9ASCO|nr:ARE2 [Candida oxycetoniae]KAI3404532.2 ARE2 [Candida oxycetoniae]
MSDHPISQPPIDGASKLTLSPESKLHGFEWWRRSLQYQTGLGQTPQEKAQFEYDFQNRDLDKKCETCKENLNWVLKYSPSVLFMMDHIRKLNKDNEPVPRSKIVCQTCDFTKGGGFNPELGIVLCSNWIRSKWQLEDILTHELVHLYDFMRFDVDINNLRHHACMEIRASMLSGECRVWNEIRKTGLGNFGKKFQDCIRRRAIISVAANPICNSKEEAESVVNLVWKSCFNDTRPFERVYRRDLLDINNDYNASSSSDNEDSDASKTLADAIELQDSQPEQLHRIGKQDSRNGVSSSFSTTTSSFSPRSPLSHEASDTSRSSKDQKSSKVYGHLSRESESDINLDGHVKYVFNQGKIRLKKKKNNESSLDKEQEQGPTKKYSKAAVAAAAAAAAVANGKYRLKFGDLTFKSSSTTIFDSEEFKSSQFFGMYVLFWLYTAFVSFNNLVHIYFENATPVMKWSIVLILRRDLLKVGLTDLVMYLASYFPYFLQVLVIKRWISWRKIGWIIESVYEAIFVVVFVWFGHYMNFPWIARVFLVLHSLVFLMKIHSYAFYNGYLWEVYNEGLFSESYLDLLLKKQVVLPKGHEEEKTIELLKGSIEFTKYELEYQSRATTDKPESDKHKDENVRLDLSFKELQDKGCIIFPQNINLRNYFEYNMIPPFLMEYLFTFFLIWDSVLNALAELTLFADRDFYGPWWSCTDFSEFARLWNKPVHNFLLRHVYHSSISALKVNRIQAALITFILSSIVHELVMYVIFGSVRGYLLLFQMSQIPLVMMSKSKLLRDKKVLGNCICWFGFISGPSIICCLYLVF